MTDTTFFIRAARVLLLPVAWLSERLGNRFYIGLAVLLAIIFTYAIMTNLMHGMKYDAYDLIMQNRYNVPPADPDIVLIDIDEASLAAMAPEYGRWPWPRSVMAEMVEGLAQQQARAIVFDITFSDPDIYHPDADRYFRDVTSRHSNTYFPMIRLNPENDAKSELRLSRLPGVKAASPDASPEATVAMVVPYLFDVLDGARLGTNNLYSDADGITRRYHVYREAYGWQIGSLPANVAAQMGGTLPAQPDILLNWRGKPLAYHTVSFHAVYKDMLKQQRERPANEFINKIVIIGSTAPSLFDLKPTPIAQNHPGLEILAVTLDNLKNGDYLRESPRWITLLAMLLSLTALAIAFVYNVDYKIINPVFTVMQTAFLAVTYLFLNYSPLFVDMTAPFTAALLYFFIARAYSIALTFRRNGHPIFSTILDQGNTCQVLLLHCRFDPADRSGRRRLRGILQRHAGLTRYGVAAPRIFKPAPLLKNIYSDTLLFYWLVAPNTRCAALRDLIAMLEESLQDIQDHDADSPTLGMHLHSVHLNIDGDGGWRTPGKQAFIETMTAPPAVPEPGVQLSASTPFVELCRDCHIEPPASLKNIGLHCNSGATTLQ